MLWINKRNKDKCSITIPGNSYQCEVCKETYYRDESICKECISNCLTCYNNYECTKCNDEYFLLSDLSEYISYDKLENCEDKTMNGCNKCNEGYYVYNQYCSECSNKTENCISCEDQTGECNECEDEYVLSNSKCIHYSLIEHCKSEDNNKCSSCSFWYRPNSDGTYCESHVVWWVISIGVLFILIIIVIILIITYFIVKKIIEIRKKERTRE